MRKQILISRSSVDTRIGLTEDGTLAEIQVENPAEHSSAGNAYMGKVVRVLPGMQAAFIDIGLEKAAFMHVSDFWTGPEEPDDADELEDELEDELDFDGGSVDTEEITARDSDDLPAGNAEARPNTGDPNPSASIPFATAADAPTESPDAGSEPIAARGQSPEDDAPTKLPTEAPAAEDLELEEADGLEGEGLDADDPEPDNREADDREGEGLDADDPEPDDREADNREGEGLDADDAHAADADAGDAGQDGDDDHPSQADGGQPGKSGRKRRAGRKPSTPPPSIEEILKSGQEILVQVSKEPMGTKGARVTAHISLPGRYIVYMPTSNHIGVSRRIEKSRERQRLKKIVAENRPGGIGGYIVRTACQGLSKKEILGDIQFLSRLWQGIEKKASEESAPSLLHEDLDIVLRSMRDLLTDEVEEILVDDPTDHARILEFIDTALQPELKSRVRLHDSLAPLFDEAGVENQVRRALDRRVWLKSGGYLIVDQTEALTTIDVNTGRFVGKKNHEETVLKTNMEAAKACIDQLRLRNIGGIIVIDLIDMELAENRKQVSEAIEEAVKRDKARTNILKISELGLVEMTRKRTRENLQKIITTPCPSCDGLGRQKSAEAVAGDALREALRKADAADNPKSLTIRIASDIAGILRQAIEKRPNANLAERGIELVVKAEPNFEQQAYEIEIDAQPKRKRSGGRRRRRRSGTAKAATTSGETTAE